MQTYECQHCHKDMTDIFNVFLHIFLEHMHQDTALDSGECRQLLRGSRALGRVEPCLN